jgi:hypothetical protein
MFHFHIILLYMSIIIIVVYYYYYDIDMCGSSKRAVAASDGT